MTGAHSIRVRRIVDAPVERVFRAFTDPVELVRWWGPAGIRTSEAEVDLTVGGRCRWVMHPGEHTAVLHGEITALDPPGLLAMTNQWEGNPNESHVTMRFRSVDDARTEIEILHEQLPEDVPPSEYREGWLAALDSLERYTTTSEGSRHG